MGGRGNSNPFGGQQKESWPSIIGVKREVYDWIEDPEGYVTVKDYYEGSPGFDPGDPQWDEFVQFIVRKGWKMIPYPVTLPDGTKIDSVSDIPPYSEWKKKGGMMLILSIMAGLWLLLG